MKWQRLLGCAMAVTLAAGTIAGCGSQDDGGEDVQSSAPVEEENGGGQEQESGVESSETEQTGGSKYQTTYGSKQFDDVTITVEIFDRSNAPEGSSVLDNKWVDYVNREMNKVGITVEFVAVPRSDEVQKMQAMMASQTAPDITITYTYAYAQDFFSQGGIWDLTDFIAGDDQVKNLKAYLGEETMDIGKMSTGEYYGGVARRATQAQTNLFVRKDWLDEAGLSIPETPDELFDTISELIANHPDGATDVIGISFFGATNLANEVAYKNNIEMAFSQLASDPKEMDIASGYEYYYDPGCREYYRFINKCYNAGLMDKEYYTGTTDTYNSDIVNGKIAFFESEVNYSVDPLRGYIFQTLKENDPDAELVSIPNLHNVNDGKQYSAAYCPGGLVAFCPLTASEEKVEACMTYLDWLATKEGGHVLYHGFEGEHYEMNEDGVPVVKDASYNSTDKDWLRTDIFLVGNSGYFATVDEFNACTAAEIPGWEEYVIENYTNSLSGTVVPASSYQAPSSSDLGTDLGLLCSDYLTQCITCPEDEFDGIYDEFITKCEEAGIQKIIDERTEYFNTVYGE